MSTPLYSPGDIIGVMRHDTERLFRVHGNYLGGLNQESVVTLESIDSCHVAYQSERNKDGYYCVPACILDAGISAGTITHTTSDDKGGAK